MKHQLYTYYRCVITWAEGELWRRFKVRGQSILSARLLRKLGTDCGKILWNGTPWSQENVIRFWWWYRFWMKILDWDSSQWNVPTVKKTQNSHRIWMAINPSKKLHQNCSLFLSTPADKQVDPSSFHFDRGKSSQTVKIVMSEFCTLTHFLALANETMAGLRQVSLMAPSPFPSPSSILINILPYFILQQ